MLINVQYTDSDFINTNDTPLVPAHAPSFTRNMAGDILPAPVVGNLVLFPEGVFEVTFVMRDHWNSLWQVALVPSQIECNHGDIVAISTRQFAVFRCVKHEVFGRVDTKFLTITIGDVVEELVTLKQTLLTRFPDLL